MSVVIQEKAIPVIGVPPPPQPPPVPKLSDIPPLIPNKPKTLQNPTKRIPKKAPQPQNQNPPKNPGVKKIKRSKWLGPKNESELITETGLPKSENGSFVKANEQKLTAMEQKAYSLYLDAHMSLAADNMTKKAKRRHRFQLQLKWLLNKAVMMNYVNKGELAKELAKEAAEKGEKALPKEDVQKAPAPPKEKIPKTPKAPQQQKLPSMRQPKQSKYKLDNRQKVASLMDVQLPKSDDMYYHNQSATTDYQSSSDSSRGYQYLEENWINADKPWRSFQTSSSSYPTSSDYSQYHSSSMNEPMQSYPLSTSSTIDYSAYPPMSSSYAAPLNFATHQPPPSYSSFPSQLTTNPMPPSFSQPPPDFTQAPPNFIPSISEFNIPQGYVSEYRQQFPEQPQSIQNSFPPNQSYSPFSTAGLPLETALEVSEEELARQKRLLEIEEELREINAKKLRMQMEDEMRQREYQLALQEQEIQERERQIRDREMFMQEGRAPGRDRRRRYDDRGSYYQDERDDGYYRSSEPRHSSSSSKSNSHSNPRQIKIERDPEDAAAARRHGQPSQQQQQQPQKKSLPRKMMKRNGGGEEGNTSLKRSAESGSHDDIGNNIAGRIQPAKKQRVRHQKVPHAKLDMQAISDDEAGTHNFDYRPISDDEADI
ncbi:hypothetical protein CRE_13343 [Caenorhabditis remanei]|uniref:Uncharacterized protein n=1 Tax=Caenorhabditis remanei TaxID=31234 RepID=E3M8A5_CAERE|nr:hypothetical protein CRE_13343 [Caenorhabditis remanei]